MKKIILIALNLLIINSAFTQTWKGIVIDVNSRKQLEFVNIGVLHKNKGTVTNEIGKFSFDLTNLSDYDTIRISYIGYEHTDILVGQCKNYLLELNDASIELTPISFSIDEVVITANKTKKIITGNNIKSSIVVSGFRNNELGSEVGTVLKYRKKKKGYIISLNFNIASNNYDSLFFRVNLYKMKNGLPSKNILQKPIYVNSTIQKGTLTVNLSKENISIKEDSFVSIELVKNLGKNGLYFKTAFLKSPSFAKQTSQSDWNKTSVDLGFWAEISYEK